MILKASQRGGASQLAAHLLKTEENEHVEIHELNGFVSDNLHGALNEIYAVSRGTKCRQFMFSVSLNPPETEQVPIEYFEHAIANIEEKTGLKNQPRAVVFHEKEARRHCHVVWSRIDTDEMKAINLPYFKMKLQDISRQLYFQHGWQMPRGLLKKSERNPLNYTLAEWQQAKRLDIDPKIQKQLVQSCWAVSDSKDSFADVLKEQGYGLARGDRRGYVAVDYQGEVFSLTRLTDLKMKQLKNRLGKLEELPSIATTKKEMAGQMTARLKEHIEEAKNNVKIAMEPLIQRKRALITAQRKTRQELLNKQETRWQKETMERSQHFPRGLKAIWFRITGKYQKIKVQNEQETKACSQRDRKEKQALISQQLSERIVLQKKFHAFKQERLFQICALKQDLGHYRGMTTKSQNKGENQLLLERHVREPDPSPER